jgi:hydrogenase/urease accessory protein HupE
MIRALRLVAPVAALVLASPAAGHRLAPSLLELHEQGDGLVAVRWKTPLQRPVGSEIEPVLPAHCKSRGDPTATPDATSLTLRWSVRCGERGLVGSEVGVRGLETSGTNALVRISLADGRSVRVVLHADSPTLSVPERQGRGEVALDYAGLGVDHILTGLDHLLFVLGLVLLVRGRRLLIYTITSFTLGHSVTLSLAALGFVRFPQAPIEVVIAATIAILAAELARGAQAEPTPMRRFPWVMAFGFGLLHGLGFAGALAEIGLPDGEIPLALLSFNLGIEAGQLVFVAAVLAVRALARPAMERAPVWLVRVPVYGMGGLAVFWVLDRSAALF